MFIIGHYHIVPSKPNRGDKPTVPLFSSPSLTEEDIFLFLGTLKSTTQGRYFPLAAYISHFTFHYLLSIPCLLFLPNYIDTYSGGGDILPLLL